MGWLALLGPAGASPKRLAELLWAKDAPVYPQRQLNVLLNQLRCSLGHSVVAASGPRVGLARGMAEVDAERFTSLLCDESTTPFGDAAGLREQALRTALGLWRGSPHPEIADHSEAVGEILRLTRLHVLAVGELALIRVAGAEPPCDGVAGLYPALAEAGDGDTLGAVVALALALAARRVEALRALAALQPRDAGQRAWRAATEQAIRLDDGATLGRQLAELQATISATWRTSPNAYSDRVGELDS